jgi:hypothetical protein
MFHCVVLFMWILVILYLTFIILYLTFIIGILPQSFHDRSPWHGCGHLFSQWFWKCFYSTISRPNESLGNPTYTPTTPTIKEILDNLTRSVLRSFAISTKNEELNLPSFYRIFKLHIKSLQTAFLYCWVCQMLLETSFQIGKIYYHVFVC